MLQFIRTAVHDTYHENYYDPYGDCDDNGDDNCGGGGVWWIWDMYHASF